MKTKLIITCEHASNNILEKFKYLFSTIEAKKNLNEHYGLDIGAKKITEIFAKEFSCPVIIAEYSRLLIELNRSLDNPNLFSKYSKSLEQTLKQDLIKNIYYPYRNKTEQLIRKLINKNNIVIHLSIHSFTPVLNNKNRTTDIGLLYDPKRSLESKFCKELKTKYQKEHLNFKIKLNYPYRGYSDGFTSYLRTKFHEKDYIGIELEFNQKHFINKFNAQLVYSLIDEIKNCI